MTGAVKAMSIWPPGPSSGSTAVGQGGAGGYGIAPKQVVYRPAPPSDRPGGTAPRR